MLGVLSGRTHEVLTGVVVGPAGPGVVGGRLHAGPLPAADRRRDRLVRGERRAARQGGRLRRPGAGVTVCRVGRRVLQQRRRPAGRRCVLRRLLARATGCHGGRPARLTGPAPEGIL
ncbi:MAG: hypothetical protein MZV64_73290 [Ignavibacteriales bacterium]|nr:hypothetical protein [Ignavibacteriales bacterium]